MDVDKLTNAEKIAWDMILPYQHIPILPDDRRYVDKCTEILEKVFTEEQLKTAVEKLQKE